MSGSRGDALCFRTAVLSHVGLCSQLDLIPSNEVLAPRGYSVQFGVEVLHKPDIKYVATNGWARRRRLESASTCTLLASDRATVELPTQKRS